MIPVNAQNPDTEISSSDQAKKKKFIDKFQLWR